MRPVVMSMVGLVAWVSSGCAAPAPAARPTATAARPTAAPAPPAPRCRASEPSAPADARDVMKRAGEEVKACFLLGKAGAGASSVVVDLQIQESGGVGSRAVRADGAEASQKSCVEGVLSKLRFSTFCGAPVALQWTYAVASR